MKDPVEMPDLGNGMGSYVIMQQFEIQRQDYMAPEAGGRIGGVQAGFPLWSSVWTLGRMPVANSDEWRAWLSSLRGATRRFIGRDVARPRPREYVDSGFPGGFTGACSDWSSTINADGDCELTLEGLPAGFEISQGDYTDFRWTATEDSVAGLPWRALVRAVESVTADGSGNATFIVEPPVPSAVPGSAVAHLDEPGCIMTLVLEQTSLESIDPLRSIQGGQITAIQDIRA